VMSKKEHGECSNEHGERNHMSEGMIVLQCQTSRNMSTLSIAGACSCALQYLLRACISDVLKGSIAFRTIVLSTSRALCLSLSLSFSLCCLFTTGKNKLDRWVKKIQADKAPEAMQVCIYKCALED
jgi:hypothetical protein